VRDVHKRRFGLAGVASSQSASDIEALFSAHPTWFGSLSTHVANGLTGHLLYEKSILIQIGGLQGKNQAIRQDAPQDLPWRKTFRRKIVHKSNTRSRIHNEGNKPTENIAPEQYFTQS